MKKRKAKNEPTKKKKLPDPPASEENKFDFGGLPSRDLKKNLGCG